MRIGVYVGSFDPVHNGHEKIVNHLLNKNYLDKIIIIPTGNYWDKQNITKLNHREKMLKLIFNNNIEINTHLSKYNYTYEIMRKLHNTHSKDDLYLILGADNIENFYKWKNYKEILKSNIIIIPRDKINVEKLINKYEEKDKFTIINDYKLQDISSTFIKESIKNDNIKKINKLINKKVLEYIVSNNLYKR